MNQAIIAAAGSGSRFGRPGGKQFAGLAGHPLLAYAIEALEGVSSISKIVIVVSEDDLKRCGELIERSSFKKVTSVIKGAGRRQDSVHRGLREISGNPDKILIHDGARPLITTEKIESVIAAAADDMGAILAVPVTDTVKRCDDEGIVEETPLRDGLWLAQTPQVFPFAPLLSAYGQAAESGIDATDDAAVYEASGGKVRVVMGDYRNIKITTSVDLKVAELLLAERMSA